jgi:hypothetical protein
MKLETLLLDAIRSSEIPLRFEPGAEESVAKPVTTLLKQWIASHAPLQAKTDFEYGQKALAAQLLAELDGQDL